MPGNSRHQMCISSLENAIGPENQVHFIDRFTCHLCILNLGIKAAKSKVLESSVELENH